MKMFEKSVKMLSPTSSGTRAAVLATSRKVKSDRKIAKEVIEMGYVASYQTVRRISLEEINKENEVTKKPKRISTQNTRP